MSQAGLATRAGTTQDAISRIERGAEAPSFDRLERLLLCVGLRAEVETSTLVDHGVDSRRLARTARMTPQDRLDEALGAQGLVRAIDRAASAGDR